MRDPQLRGRKEICQFEERRQEFGKIEEKRKKVLTDFAKKNLIEKKMPNLGVFVFLVCGGFLIAQCGANSLRWTNNAGQGDSLSVLLGTWIRPEDNEKWIFSGEAQNNNFPQN